MERVRMRPQARSATIAWLFCLATADVLAHFLVVGGASGSLKRSIGSRIMADQMKAMFELGRKRIER